jgi:hypothetical protein
MDQSKQIAHHVMALPIVICQANEHYNQWNCGTCSGNLNAKWICLWSTPKAFVILDMHCSDGLFDQMWSNREPYIIVFSWNWSFILLIVINSNKCFTFEFFLGEHPHLNPLKQILEK